MDEKRKTIRVTLKAEAQYQPIAVTEIKYCAVWDICKDGIRIQTEEFIPVDAQCRIDFKLPTNGIINLVGSVAWIQKLPQGDKYTAGIRISDNSVVTEANQQIERYVVMRKLNNDNNLEI